jgi:hypothetical protein
MGCKGCQKYVILRFAMNEPTIIQAINLTLEEAREWTAQEDTRGDSWFDGYTAQQHFHVEAYNESQGL